MAQEVLVVDDDRTLAGSLTRAIEKLGYACRQAHDGVAAIEAVQTAKPDLILLDLLLPKKDGHAVLEWLQSQPSTAEIPVITISGVFRGRDQEAQMIEAGAKAFLPKPFAGRDLAALLLDLIGRADPEETDGEPEERIDLTETPPVAVIGEAIAGGFTGAIHFKLRKRYKVLILEDGAPCAVRSNLAREALGRRLFAAGRIDERTLQDSLKRSKATGKPQGEVLVEIGAIHKPELITALRQQVEEKLLDLFAWSEGEAWLQEGVRAVSLSSKIAGWSAQRLLLRGVERVPAGWMSAALEPLKDNAVTRTDLELENLEDRIGVGALLEAVEGGATVGQLAGDFLPALYALWTIGALHIDGDASATQATIAAASSQKGSRAASLEALLEEQAGMDHFELLDVDRNAGVAEVRKAFVALAKTYHPDKFADADSEERDLAAQLFARYSEAHETLCDSELRAAYLKELAGAGDSPADQARVQALLTAEQQFQKAEALAKRKQWDEAMACVDEALEIDAEEGEFHALRGWLTAMMDPESEETVAAALQMIEKGASLAPKSPTPYLYAGRLHKICGRVAEAERMFGRCLELRPNHVEASQEMRLIKRRQADSGGSSKGLFGFGRKK